MQAVYRVKKLFPSQEKQRMREWKRMGRRLIRMAAGLIALVMMIPVYSEADDGGSREFSALLYRIVLQCSMAQRDGETGYLAGTKTYVLGTEVYHDVTFVPTGGK